MHDLRHLLSCTELRDVTICPIAFPGDRHYWQAVATLGRLHGRRLQLQLTRRSLPVLEEEPSLAAHVSQAELSWPWRADDRSGLVDQVSSLSSLTKLTLRVQASAQGGGPPGLGVQGGTALRWALAGTSHQGRVDAGMLDALRQLPALQSLHCLATVLETLLVNSVAAAGPC